MTVERDISPEYATVNYIIIIYKRRFQYYRVLVVAFSMCYRESIIVSSTEATYAIILTGQLSYERNKWKNNKCICT